MAILVLGGAGYIGSHTVYALSLIHIFLENIPVGVPVVLWDTEAESPRVKANVSFDREAIARLLVEKVAEARDKGQSVTLVSHKDRSDQMQNMHDLLEEMFPQAGIMVRRCLLYTSGKVSSFIIPAAI